MHSLAAQWIAGLILMIIIFLLLKDPGGTSKIIGTIAGAQNNTILALQGRGSGSFQNIG